MRLGINSGTFGKTLSWEEKITGAGEIGYEGVELNVDRDALLPREWDGARRAAIRSLAERSGVAITSLCLNCHWKYNMASPDAATRDEGTALLLESIALAVDVGAPALLVPGCDTGETTPEQSYALFRDSLASCLSAAEEAGVRLAVEAVGKQFLFDTRKIRGLIEELGSPVLGIYLDVGNATSGGLFAPEEIALADGLALLCHVKDEGGRFFGEGSVDFEACMAALRGIGYDGYLVPELRTDPDDPLATARAAKRWLDGLLARA